MSRKPRNIDPQELQKIIGDLEADREFGSQSELWAAVAATEWAQNLPPKPLTAANVPNYVRKFDLTFKTQGTRGKQLDYTAEDFQAEVDRLEESRTFKNPSKLWDALSETEFGRKYNISPATAYQRAQKWDIKLKTSPGRRTNGGNTNGDDSNGEQQRTHGKPVATRVELEARAFANRWGGGGLVIITPAGPCPVKLQATDQESVEKWCEAVVQVGQQDGKLYSPHALLYFTRQFIEMFADEGGYSPEYLNLKQYIYEWAQIDGMAFAEPPVPVTQKRYVDDSSTYVPRRKTELYEDEQDEESPRERDDRETLTVGKTSFGSDDD